VRPGAASNAVGERVIADRDPAALQQREGEQARGLRAARGGCHPPQRRMLLRKALQRTSNARVRSRQGRLARDSTPNLRCGQPLERPQLSRERRSLLSAVHALAFIAVCDRSIIHAR
jgi:hypothetical protein